MMNKQESERAEELLEIMMKEVKPRQEALSSHGIYPLLTSVEAITEFMKFHIFAVWDFMSVVKTMQRHLTCVEVPWVPVQHPELARLINDIVLTEESDVNWDNEAQSHFVMYMEAMKEVGVDMSQITLFMSFIRLEEL
ncbi:uncharacterized protein LOC111709498 [Eurytemora carolleeae]|uniref:uncharacterized protein LOC111709498 n=1 Tax=Eurytemora carolleeae TaxID=1294199 RepID=UPI000C778D2D|nr:uncharacterized protein LOC111709498 [Eurytemora carolleeae]|eukprot:XP_023338948.1 uncharacterized protein LOC111709498 [Eurytemora affinis]